MSFVYIYSVLQISNPVWTNYLILSLGFGNFDLGVITMASALFSWAGDITVTLTFTEVLKCCVLQN